MAHQVKNLISLGCDDRCTTINVIKFIEKLKKKESGSSHHGAAETNPTRNHEVVGFNPWPHSLG